MRYGREGDKKILRDLLHFIDRGLRRHQPAQTPARHTEILGKTVDDESVRVDFQDGWRTHIVAQAVIDFVHHQVALPRAHFTGQGREFLPREHRACRIGWRRHHRPHRVVPPMLRYQGSIELIIHGCIFLF